MARNAERRRIYQRNRVNAKRAKHRAVLSELKTAGCVKCGQKHPATLQFHHRDPSTKVDSVNHLLTQARSLAVILEEIAKCDLLCANCHAIQHWDETH